jgi:hypothetical protein
VDIFLFLMFFGGLVVAVFAISVNDEPWAPLLAITGIAFMAVSGLCGYGYISDKHDSDRKFRSMYEIASPCRLHDVDWCDGGECQVVIRCKDGE